MCTLLGPIPLPARVLWGIALAACMCRALTLLPRRKHVPVILKFALMEYKNSFVERGRTIFEGLLSSEPKRVDLWSVYIDQEVAAGEL